MSFVEQHGRWPRPWQPGPGQSVVSNALFDDERVEPVFSSALLRTGITPTASGRYPFFDGGRKGLAFSQLCPRRTNVT